MYSRVLETSSFFASSSSSSSSASFIVLSLLFPFQLAHVVEILHQVLSLVVGVCQCFLPFSFFYFEIYALSMTRYIIVGIVLEDFLFFFFFFLFPLLNPYNLVVRRNKSIYILYVYIPTSSRRLHTFGTTCVFTFPLSIFFFLINKQTHGSTANAGLVSHSRRFDRRQPDHFLATWTGSSCELVVFHFCFTTELSPPFSNPFANLRNVMTFLEHVIVLTRANFKFPLSLSFLSLRRNNSRSLNIFATVKYHRIPPSMELKLTVSRLNVPSIGSHKLELVRLSTRLTNRFAD